MGNYTYLDEQTGLKIDWDKVPQDIKSYFNADKSDDRLGDLIDGWNHGYWYSGFNSMLLKLLPYIESLTPDYEDNYLEMTEEQGVKCWIYFNIDGIKVSAVPWKVSSGKVNAETGEVEWEA